MHLIFQSCIFTLKEKTEIKEKDVGTVLSSAHECNSTNIFSVSTSGQALCQKLNDQTISWESSRGRGTEGQGSASEVNVCEYEHHAIFCSQVSERAKGKRVVGAKTRLISITEKGHIEAACIYK